MYLVVADAARARLFHANAALTEIEEREDLAHDASRLHSRELRSDHPGKTQAFSGGPQSGIEEGQEHRHELEVFAGQLAARLTELADAGAYQRLVLVAPPRFLGILRPKLAKRVADRIGTTLTLDLTPLPRHELIERLRSALSAT